MFWIKSAIEILILFFLFYYLVRSLHGTQGEGVIKGYVFLFVFIFTALLILVRYFSFHNFEHILTRFLNIYLFAIVVIFQPELRNGLIQLGQVLFGRILEANRTEKEIVKAVSSLANQKIGALIAIEENVGLGDYIDKGIRLDARITKEMLCTIFWPGTPLHDGGVVIKDDRIAAAACIFPLSEKKLPAIFGTRHRAALGISEISDALVLTVSEERGEISVCFKGKMEERVSVKKLESILREFFREPDELLPENAQKTG